MRISNVDFKNTHPDGNTVYRIQTKDDQILEFKYFTISNDTLEINTRSEINHTLPGIYLYNVQEQTKESTTVRIVFNNIKFIEKIESEKVGTIVAAEVAISVLVLITFLFRM